MLDRLDAGGIPFGIITNGSQRQWQKIDRLGLRHRARPILVSEEFGAKKPDLSIYLAGIEALGVEPQTILFVGDNPELDIVGPKGVHQSRWFAAARSRNR